VAALEVLVTGADVVVVVESVDDDEDSDAEVGTWVVDVVAGVADPAVVAVVADPAVVDEVAGVAAEWAVVSVATRIPSPTAENAAVAPTSRVTRLTRATARSRDRTAG
jgi:hypothetical protein